MIRVYFLFFVPFCFGLAHGQSLEPNAPTKDSTNFSKIELIQRQLEELSENELPGLNENVDFRITGASLDDLIRGLAETHQLNVSLSKLPVTRVSNNFNNVKVKDLIVFLCLEYELDIDFVGSIMSISGLSKPIVPPVYSPVAITYQNGLLTLDLKEDSLVKVAKAVTRDTDVNVIIGNELQGYLVTGYFEDLEVGRVMEELAYANDLELAIRDNKVFAFSLPPLVEPAVPTNANGQPQRNRRSHQTNRANKGDFQIISKEAQLISFNGQQAGVASSIKDIADALNISYLFFSEPDGLLDAHFYEVSFDDFIRFALENSEATYTIDNNVYLIGDKTKVALNQYKVYQFKNRSVEGVLENILPAELLEGLTISEAIELNAVIINGSDMKMTKLISFIEEIDIRVPNILIEVILVDIRKGNSISTGIRAGLADSVPPTSGTIFPGLDMSFSSNSINNFLEDIDKRGVINLGRVTPQFYATVQALEDNNFLNIRSTPKLSTLNGNKATLTIGEKVYYLIENQNITPGVNPIVTISPNYLPVEANLQIDITPFVSSNEDITLEIVAEFSDFINPEVEGGPPGSATRKFESKIRVKNEEMIVLGGLEEARKTETGSGVPFLSRIPGLKWLFSSKTKSKAESKLVVFIKPYIAY